MSFKIISFFLGLTCALVAAARFRADMTPVMLMSSPFFIGGLIVAVISLLLWRQDVKQLREDTDKDSEESTGLKLLEGLNLEITIIEKELASLSREQLLSKLQGLQENFIIPFIEQRSQLEKKLDANLIADVLLKFAYGERMLNRAYSCSADGFPEESKSLLPTAKKSFEECLSFIR